MQDEAQYQTTRMQSRRSSLCRQTDLAHADGTLPGRMRVSLAWVACPLGDVGSRQTR